ncbi:MAG: glycosyltransferase [Clostridiales bacterium]|jgi:rhamnosyl/mannosyltransferase|nr:glycosyltransferase [Clostridiales bacterium]
MRKLKVLQTNKLYAPWIGGVERVVQDIAEGLNAETEMTVLVCQGKGRGIQEVYNGVRLIRCSSLGIKLSMPVSFSYIFEFARYAKRSDIVHIHLPFPLADIALFFSGYKGKLAVWWHSGIVRQKKLLALLKPWICGTLKRADVIFVSSDVLADNSEFLKDYRDKCVTVPYGAVLPVGGCQSANGYLRRRLNIESNKKVLFVGRLVYYKGIGVLTRAFREVRGAELFVVGTGILEEEVMRYVHAENIEDKIHFLGRLSDSELKEAYADCDFLVLPSVAASEAFGLVQIEAMARGKPVINTALPTSVPFVSVNNETGITVEPGNIEQLNEAIQLLADDDGLRERYGVNARRRVEGNFTMEEFLSKVYDKYMELVYGEESAYNGDYRAGRVVSGGTAD